MTDHYFSAASGDAPTREVRATLAGHERSLLTAPGVFSGDGLDVGTSVLLDETPEPPRTGDLLDLGTGWGPVALSLALRAPEARVWAVDVNPRAVDLVRRNAERVSVANVTAALPGEMPDVRFQGIWSNPPIRIGKQQLHALLLEWLPRLVVGGEAWLVVQKHLGSDSLLRWLDEQDGLAAERWTSKKTFRILRVERVEG
ncbi:class I SAM-dependent methyltransferase [Agrococcus jejuensis]|uniref:Methyltransferase small domain-containing protein n=1 Tax=Agrococcus jejuensis TaxID=399736 RepID=A0A1G8AM00_9MICO|nr:methyltransferase [Agrococcus jejuensis]SDH22055.1 Methyltransferase small domain-containing protein [Agrococcus jejuensis]